MLFHGLWRNGAALARGMETGGRGQHTINRPAKGKPAVDYRDWKSGAFGPFAGGQSFAFEGEATC